MSSVSRRSFSLTSATGCLVPFLLCANLFFGWLFLPFIVWILLEVILLVFFLYGSVIIFRRIQAVSQDRKEIIDVEAKKEE